MKQPLSGEEIRDLAISVAGLGLAFTIMYFGGGDPVGFLLSPAVIPALLVTMALVAFSFIPHEMSHRVTARSMDTYTEYRMWTPGVALSVLTSFIGFVFAAPGGFRMYMRAAERWGLRVEGITIKMIGYVAISGPLINISLAVMFSFLSASISGVELFGRDLFFLGARINTFLALFTLVPIYPMDGYKVLRWSATTWLFTLAMAILTFFLLPPGFL